MKLRRTFAMLATTMVGVMFGIAPSPASADNSPTVGCSYVQGVKATVHCDLEMAKGYSLNYGVANILPADKYGVRIIGFSPATYLDTTLSGSPAYLDGYRDSDDPVEGYASTILYGYADTTASFGFTAALSDGSDVYVTVDPIAYVPPPAPLVFKGGRAGVVKVCAAHAVDGGLPITIYWQAVDSGTPDGSRSVPAGKCRRFTTTRTEIFWYAVTKQGSRPVASGRVSNINA